jgi:hypothetical protein
MIDVFFANMVAALKIKGMPYDFVYGPAPVPTQVGASRVIMSRDFDAGDQIKPARTRQPYPRQYAIIGAAFAIRIYASSTKASAQRVDHDLLAMMISQAILPELEKTIRALKTTHAITRVGPVNDLNVPDGWQGVVYEIRFQIDLGMNDQPWVADTGAEFTMTATTTVNHLATPTGPVAGHKLPTATTTEVEQ